MKKKILLVGVSMMLCMLCGCLQATPLTEEEMDAVAEYSASLLLKYDKRYDTPLYYIEEREARLTPTPTPLPTKKATPTPTPEAGNPPSSGNDSSPEPTKEPYATPTPVPALYSDEETTKQLTEMLAVEHITVSCEKFEMVDSVVSNNYFSLQAKEGRQYVVVRFKLKNDSNQKITFDASGKGLEYSVDVNVNTRSRVSLSMLENDLQYMPIEVPANGTADAVLVFEIADTEVNTLHLLVEDKEDDVIFVKLQ